jgi:hypothetical protein
VECDPPASFPRGCNLIPGDSPLASLPCPADSFSSRSQGRVQGSSRLLRTRLLNPERPELPAWGGPRPPP